MKINKLHKRLEKKVVRDAFGYETITLSIKGSPSFFTFLYTPQVQNFEKTEYHIENLEELYVFIKALLQCKEELNVRYCELFVSAYAPEHQQIFYDAGFRPRGYVPSWEYCSKNDCFKDMVLFSMFEGQVSKDIQLIKQGQELVQTIGLAQFSEAGSCVEVAKPQIDDHEPVVEMMDTVSCLKSQKAVKHSILGAMWAYLSLLFLGLIIATGFGYNIIVNTISDLGSSDFTPFPFIFDMACIIAGIITIPYNLFLHTTSTSKTTSKVIHFTSRCGLIWGIIGGVGYLCLGIFSSDRGGPHGMFHGLSAMFSFTGFVLSILFFSVQFIFHTQKTAKIFGICGIVIPAIMLLLNFIQITPLLEWTLLFSILFHIIPLNHWSVIR